MTDYSKGFHIYRDGNAWCAVGPDFRNLQEDRAGFGDTPESAYANWWEDNKYLNRWRGVAPPGFDRFTVHKAVEGLAPVRESATDLEPRKIHYGPGRQPWDDILEDGYGPGFAYGCVLRYLRRDKALEHSLESARWYATRIAEGAFAHKYGDPTPWVVAWSKLSARLTVDEETRIGPLAVPASGLREVAFPGCVL